jgi:hypothetical protein
MRPNKIIEDIARRVAREVMAEATVLKIFSGAKLTPLLKTKETLLRA